ncbi:MAG: hypothetical protein V3S45_07175 [Kiloniellales bacterium]
MRSQRSGRRRGSARAIMVSVATVAIVAILGFLLSGPAAAQETAPAAVAPAAVAYVAGVEDLPLMPGLVEVAGAGVVFDKPAGRIVEAYVQGQVDREAVLRFYRRSLPPLGWEVLGETRFRREGEELGLEFVSEEGPLVLRFSLRPE